MKILGMMIGLWLLVVGRASAESVTAKSGDPSPEAQQASFTVHPDFEVNLFADETLGIANPIAIHWDHRGRLWVLTTEAYAQLKPGQKADDKIFVLEDLNGDGKADRSKVFADGLDMPLGFALAENGVYVGEGDKLLRLQDTDDDGVADTREVVLRGFGTGDTHQNISNFTWGPDGCLYFSQGLHCYSRVETPWGIVRGDTAGFFRFDPRSLKLQPFCFPSMASQNPCGIAFDQRGSMFLKSNNKELIYVTPGLVPTTHSRNLVPIASIGATPGKSMGAEYVQSEHLPDWLQGHMLVSGYYSHRVTAFPLLDEGAGYARVEPLELLVAGHSSFRPVDTRIGPDGAIYVADWFNPIIGHYQASLRHPDRDVEHGRIWRITAKGRALTEEMPSQLTRQPWTEEQEAFEFVDFGQLDPHERLQQVVALANRPQPDSVKLALKVLDHEPDRFVDYALRQTLHALTDVWGPALQSGELVIENSDHLAFALEELNPDSSMAIVRRLLEDPDFSATAKLSLNRVLAKIGDAGDLRRLLLAEHRDDRVLRAMADSWRQRKTRAADPYKARLKELVAESESLEIRIAAVELAGLWLARSLEDDLRKLALAKEGGVALRVAAMESFARLERKKAVAPLVALAGDPAIATDLRVGAVAALVLVDLPKAAGSAAQMLSKVSEGGEAERLLVSFAGRKGGFEALAAALGKQKIGEASAGIVLQALSRIGRGGGELAKVLEQVGGVVTAAQPYSPEWVAKLVTEVEESGDAKAGAEIYQRAELTCVACHQIDDKGGVLGPSLDTVGAGLPIDLLVESVLWPQRQLKEGYFAISVTTRDGRFLTGYKELEQKGVLQLRDTATAATHSLPLPDIVERSNVGSLMPAGLTAGLERKDLRDLIAYLASLKGGK